MQTHRRLALALALATATVTLPSSDAHAALNAYLKLKGQKQGDIKGSVTSKGQENAIKVLAIQHEIVSPRDAASGLPTGKRMHKPLRVTIPVDRAMPLLYESLVNNENITEFRLPVYTPSPKTGVLSIAYEIKLTNASVAAIVLQTPDDPKEAETLLVSFTYQRIEWVWTDGGITSSDDWEAPVAASAPKKPKGK